MNIFEEAEKAIEVIYCIFTAIIIVNLCFWLFFIIPFHLHDHLMPPEKKNSH